jgi:hypothetical protein
MGAAMMLVSLAAADPIFPPGERIGLEPPPGLRLSTHFSGFEDPDAKVAITILDLPGRAYGELEKSLFGKGPPGLTVEKREMFAFNGGVGFLVTADALVDGAKVHQWLLLANVANAKIGQIATLVNVQVPAAVRAAYPDKAIRAALASVTFRPAPLEERLKLLPFKLDQLAGFRPIQVVPGGVILTDGPSGDLNKQPYMIIGVGPRSPDDPDARGRFARDLLSGVPVRDLVITSAEPMRIGGWPGNEIKAQGKGMDGAPINLVQWLRFGAGGFLRIVGIARKDEWDRMFTRFRAVRDGIDLR